MSNVCPILPWTENLKKQEPCRSTIIRFVGNLPGIKQIVRCQIQKEKEKITQSLRQEDHYEHVFSQLPADGLSMQDIMAIFKERVEQAPIKAEQGKVSGALYHNDPELLQVQQEMGMATLFGNPLHPDVSRHYLRMEAEVCAMVAELFNGGDQACGVMTSGGTDSIIHCCMAYRNKALKEKNILHPEMVVPSSVHAAFEKAGEMFGIRVVKVPVDPETGAADALAMKAAINKNTILLVGSAPSYAHGAVDPIEELGAIAQAYDLPLHVDACLGSLLVAVAPDLGADIPLVDFRVPGVTSMSVDTHKYGYAPKGSSVALYRNKELRHYQMFTHTDWMGGIYATPSIPGSRSGLSIATTWATCLKMGKGGYVDAARRVLETRKAVQEIVEDFEELEVIGNPQLSVVAFKSDSIDVYDLADAMKMRGWEFNGLQNPPALHFCSTLVHADMGEDFLKMLREDLSQAVEEVRGLPKKGRTSTAKMYATSASIPKQYVEAVARHWWDCIYNLPEDNQEGSNQINL